MAGSGRAFGGHDKAAERGGRGPGAKFGRSRHTVTIVPDGFLWQEKICPSLSAIARLITGANWNGPRFFNLPSWAKMLSGTFAIPSGLKAQSPCAILCLKSAGRITASTFSDGHMYLNDRSTRGDFGLKVTINALTDGKLKVWNAPISQAQRRSRMRTLRNCGRERPMQANFNGYFF
jgi:hypothetical protein